jgi:orotidine-5'-phosphate decarboxylase
VPGVGAQGGDTNQLSVFFDERGSGALVSASRSLIFAYRQVPAREEAFQDMARAATIKLSATVNRARSDAAEKDRS